MSKLFSLAVLAFLAAAGFMCIPAKACSPQYPEIPYLVSEDRAKVPASFRAKRNQQGESEGIEVVELDRGISPQASYRFNRNGRTVTRKFSPGDVITSLNGQPTRNAFDLFRLMSHPGDHSVVVLARGQQVTATMNARPVSCPKLFNPEPLAGARVFVVHIVDNNDAMIGSKISTNIYSMKELFQSNVEKKRIAEYILISETAPNREGKWVRQPEHRRCNAMNILHTINDLAITENDTLFVYYQGHGGFSPQRNHWHLDTSAGQFFQLDGDDLLRSALARLMLSKNGRMTILISDCCNTKSAFESQFESRMRTAMYNIEGWTRLESLLFCHAGFVDVTSASRGNMSWCTEEYGSWFTHTFISNVQGGGGSGESGSWAENWANIKDRSRSFYKSQREQFINLGIAPQALINQEQMPGHEYQLDVERQYPPDPPGRRQIPALTKVGVYVPRTSN